MHVGNAHFKGINTTKGDGCVTSPSESNAIRNQLTWVLEKLKIKEAGTSRCKERFKDRADIRTIADVTD